jgi:hypothetical protein
MKRRIRDMSHLLTIDYAKSFLRMMRNNDNMTIRELHIATIHTPAPCWYISTTQAMRFINRLNHGDDIRCSDRRRRMYTALYERVRIISQIKPTTDLHSIVEEVINNTAPEYYISLRTAYRLLHRYRQYRKMSQTAKY